ncbi:MAG: hypothetical protein NC124_15320 [Clostridium sp.]|nr:hypothetical protein [Clostridium sp.]
MLAAVKGYYDGKTIVMDEDVKLTAGQEVIVTVLDTKAEAKQNINLSKYVGRGGKMFQADAQEYIRELRENDRL